MSKSSKNATSYLKYSGIVFQMAGILFVSGWIGQKLDEYFNTEQPYIMMALMIFMLITYLWKLAIDLNDEAKKK